MHTGNPRIDESQSELIVGSDEAGRGNWAGPIVVVAVAVPRGWKPPLGLTDSKKIKNEAFRFSLRALLLKDPALSYKIIQSEAEHIDRVGVHRANILGHVNAHRSIVLQHQGSALRIADGDFPLGDDIVSLPKADALIPAVSAASILAKTTLDLFMRELHVKFPQYGFDRSHGYGTPQHEAALAQHGPCEAHRRSFEPVRRCSQPRGPTLDELFSILDDE